MNYKKSYYKLKGKNKNLSDKIENLKLEISSMKSTQSKSVDEINSLVNELEEIRLEFLSVIRDLEKCKELYTILRKMYMRDKKLSMLYMRIVDKYYDIKYKIIDKIKLR